jgi:hypothetical protein
MAIPIDMGFLGESLLFYRRVHVVGNRIPLEYLLSACGVDVFQELLDSRRLNFIFTRNMTGVVQTENSEIHAFTAFEAERGDLQDYLPKACEAVIGRSGNARRAALRLMPLIARTRYPPEVTAEANSDIRDADYLSAVVADILALLAPDYALPKGARFIARPLDESQFVVETDIDFSAANRSYHQRVPASHSTLTPAYLLALCVARPRRS